MRDCFAIYLLSSTSWYQIFDLIQTSDPNFITWPLIQTTCLGLWWCIIFIQYTSHPMTSCNRTHYNYLLLTLFRRLFSVLLSGLGIVLTLRLFPLKYELSKTEFTLWWIMHLYLTIHEDFASIPLGQPIVTSRLSTTRLRYQAHRLSITTLPTPLLIE